jgi:hypothetical protein
MKNWRRESKLAVKIDNADRKQEATKGKKEKPRKGSGRSTQGVRPISEDLSSQYEESEDELERVGRGPK